METRDELAAAFPLASQTSDGDRRALLALRSLVGAAGTYRYVEVGSYLGGSLCPFLADERCTHVLSIDERGRDQPDERGVSYDYTGISERTMLDGLHRVGLGTDKLLTFNGSVSEFSPKRAEFDLAFIDGEHTDRACFRDFIHVLPMMVPDSIVAFHDSSLVSKALRLINDLLVAEGRSHRFVKVAGCEVSFVMLGAFADVELSGLVHVDDDLDGFYARSADRLLRTNAWNRFSAVQLLRMGLSKSPVGPALVRVAAPCRRAVAAVSRRRRRR